jgi:hypothetical protein
LRKPYAAMVNCTIQMFSLIWVVLISAEGPKTRGLNLQSNRCNVVQANIQKSYRTMCFRLWLKELIKRHTQWVKPIYLATPSGNSQ